MNISSIRAYLRPYRIYGRGSTVSYVFAAAAAPRDVFDPDRVAAALKILEQDPNELSCVYCGRPAHTWDHLVPVVKQGKQFGPGHRIRNLVPCCSPCNGGKGNRDFETWLPGRFPGWEDRLQRLRAYVSSAGDEAIPLSSEAVAEHNIELSDYWAIRDEIFRLMHEADSIADHLHELRAAAEGHISMSRRSGGAQRAAPGAAGEAKPGTIQALCMRLLAKGWSADAILAEVPRHFPQARTTKACIAWYKNKMKKEAPVG